MIVDGRTEFTGTDLGKAAKAIAEAAKVQKAKIEIAFKDDRLTVRISDLPEHKTSNIFLAIAEDNLVSRVARGENTGRTLEHQSVVRELKSIGTVDSSEKTSELETILTLSPNWKKDYLKLIVFVQENESRKVLGVGRIALKKPDVS